MRDRGLLTEEDRQKLDAVDSIDNLDEQTRANLRSKWNRRIDHVEEDIQILREVGDEKTLDKFFRQVTPANEMEQRLQRVEEELGLHDDE